MYISIAAEDSAVRIQRAAGLGRHAFPVAVFVMQYQMIALNLESLWIQAGFMVPKVVTPNPQSVELANKE